MEFISFSQLFVTLLVLTFIFVALACFADHTATRQVMRQEYRHVKLIKALRTLHHPASLCAVAAIVVALVAAPKATWTGILFGLVVGLALGAEDLMTNRLRRAWQHAFAPVLLAFIVVFNFASTDFFNEPSLFQSVPVLLLALLAAGGFPYLARQRSIQFLLAYWD